MNKSIKFLAALFVAGATFTSCSDWTDVESIGLEEPNIEQQNPEVYAKYLQGLKNYKNSEHKKVYAWFNNTNTVLESRSQHIYDVPDTVDVVVLMNPDELCNQTMVDMQDLRQKKGTKTIYDVNFDAMKVAYQEKLALNPNVEPTAMDFNKFMADSLSYALSLCKKYYYDGICVRYTGKALTHLSTSELREYMANENLFLGYLADWQKRNPEMLVAFAGVPQNVSDKSLFDKTDMIFLAQGLNASSAEEFSYYMALAEGVPANKLGMMATSISADPNYPKIGYMASGERSIEALGNWAAATGVSGIGIYDISTDYYTTPTYGYSRRAIQTIAPSAN